MLSSKKALSELFLCMSGLQAGDVYYDGACYRLDILQTISGTV